MGKNYVCLTSPGNAYCNTHTYTHTQMHALYSISGAIQSIDLRIVEAAAVVSCEDGSHHRVHQSYSPGCQPIYDTLEACS